jgi:orotidine-5'-phosphate decarboxylase
MAAADNIIVALDYEDPAVALTLVKKILPHLRVFKVGSQLFTRGGPDFVRELHALGVRVFLDLKYHDIPATVQKAVAEAVKLQVAFLTIHTSGGSAMMRAAMEAATGSETLVLGVTVLTSMDEAALREVNVAHSPGDQVLHLGRLAEQAGMRGLVCSPLEIELLRRELGPTMQLVTPGIRSATEAQGDQKRTLSAVEALRRGANYLVVGRPITQAADPAAAALALVAEIAA